MTSGRNSQSNAGINGGLEEEDDLSSNLVFGDSKKIQSKTTDVNQENDLFQVFKKCVE